MMFTPFAWLLVLAGCMPLMAGSRVWEGTLTLPTYGEGPPDANPAAAYPYIVRNSALGPRERKTWRTLEIENEYLKCTVLPDLGGRVYSCVDKIAGRDLFYANPAIRKHRGGARGVEIAAGDEFDFPVSPGMVEVSPVDFAIRQNDGGSASMFVGNTGRDGARWLVEMTLRSGSAVLEQHVTLSNPDNVRHGYTWWNRAAVPAFEDSRVYMPCYLSMGMSGGDIQPWTSSVLRTVASEKFAYRSEEGFVGVYSIRDGSGTAHYADPGVMTGKAVAYRGPEAVKNLSGDGSDFLELQAGLFPTKAGAGQLEPGQKLEFTEYWMPLRGLGGLSRVNPDAAVFLQRRGGDIDLALNAYHAIPNARIRVFEEDRVLLEERTGLEPAKTIARTIRDPKPTSKFHFELRDEKGKQLLEYTEDLYDALHAVPKTPVKAMVVPGTYDQKLEAGRAAFLSLHFEEAIPLLKAAFSYPETRHYLGLAHSYLGDDPQAKPLFGVAPRDRMFGAPSGLELAKLLGRQGDRKAALREVQEELRIRPGIAGAGALEVALLRVNRQTQDALKRLEYWLHLDPADTMLRYEAVQLGRADEALWKHLAADPERILDAAGFYLWAGLYEDALELLAHEYPEVSPLEREAGSALPREHPLVSYYRAYGMSKMGQAGREEYARASKLPLLYVFPNRPETLTVLRAALRENPADATARSLLASMTGAMRGAGATARESRPNEKSASAGESPPALPASPEQRAGLALAMVQRGRISEAAGVFTEANFPKERQSETVKEAFVEVRLQSILDLARHKRCSDVALAIEKIGDEAESVPFSMYGFGSVLKTARMQYQLGLAEEFCGDKKAANKQFARASKAGERASGRELAYGRLAAAKLGAKVTPDAAAFGKDAEGLYARGLLQRASGRSAEANADFHQALQLAGGDVILRYLCEMALAGS